MSARLLAACAAFLALLGFAGPGLAQDYQIGDLKIAQPWARATPSGAKVAGGFMTIRNTGNLADRLVGGSAAPAGLFEIHEMRMEGSVMRMRALEKGLEIAPGQSVTLRPGGFHVMFLDLKSPLREGERVKGTLVFERAGTIEVEFRVEARGAMGTHAGHAP